MVMVFKVCPEHFLGVGTSFWGIFGVTLRFQWVLGEVAEWLCAGRDCAELYFLDSVEYWR